MGKKKKGPKMAAPPDIQALDDKRYAQQTANNTIGMNQNRADQVGPMGSMSWDYDPVTGESKQTVAYNPEQQALLDQQTQNRLAMGKQAGGLIGGMDMSFGGAPKMPGVADYGSLAAAPGAVDYAKELGAMPEVGGYSQQVIDAMRGLQADPLAEARARKEAQMSAMGVGFGSGRAYSSGQQELARGENDADLKAILAGYQQGNTEYGQALQGRGQRAGELGNQWTQGMAGRQQGVSELDNQFAQALRARQQGVGEETTRYNAMMGMMGNSGPGALTFGDYYKQGPQAAQDFAGNAMEQWKANNVKAQADAARKASGGGMLGGLGGSLGSIGGAMLGSAIPGLGTALGAGLGGALGGGLDSGSWQGALQGGLGGYMQGGQGNFDWATKGITPFGGGGPQQLSGPGVDARSYL